MGTLTSCSFTPVLFNFLLSVPRADAPRERIRFPELRKSRKSCFLCRESLYKLKRTGSCANFGGFRCFSANNDNNGNGESSDSSRDSNANATKTALPEQPAEEFDSDKSSPPASVSSRVLFLRHCCCVLVDRTFIRLAIRL